MKQQFISKTFQAKTQTKIEIANAIVQEYADKGYTLTLRQLFYQMVARGYIPNTQREYSCLSETISDARLAGLVDWDALTDRTRFVRQQSHFSCTADVLLAARDSYHLDKWQRQPNYLELWIEKDALIGIAEQAARAWDVPALSCRGYCSQSEMYAAAQRFKAHSGQHCILLYAGDHDPSGIDMTRDISDRLKLFGADVDVRRIALTMDQIRHFNPPENPAKVTDSRAAGYIERYGSCSWELDALQPQILAGLIDQEIQAEIDMAIWDSVMQQERADRFKLQLLAQADLTKR